MLNFLMQAAIVPFLSILEKWLFFGILEDLHGEFFVEERSSVGFADDTKLKYEENYWNDKYILNPKKVPVFLENVATKIFLTGKYVNVIKVYDPKRAFERRIDLSRDYVFTLHSDDIRACVDQTFEAANAALLDIMLGSERLVAILKSMKKYFFMEHGDYFLHFLDLAESEMAKSGKHISADKLSNFLEIAIKTSSAANDEFSDRVSCLLTPYTTFEVLQAFNHYSNLRENRRLDFEAQNTAANFYGSKKGFEIFAIKYKIRFPLNLVLTEQTLFKYQLLFRYLLQLKYPERQLSLTWHMLMENRDLSNNLFFRRVTATLQQMIHFNRSITYHFLIDVIQRKWEELIAALEAGPKSFEHVIALHEAFLQGVFQDSLIFEPGLKAELNTMNGFINFFCENMRNLIGDAVNYQYQNVLVG